MLNGAAVAWKSKRQSVIALSSAEAEFVAASSMCRRSSTPAGCWRSWGSLSQSLRRCMRITVRVWLGRRAQLVAKHIDRREHFVHDAVASKILKLVPIASAANVADLLTKPLGAAVFLPLRKRLMGL